MPTTYQAGDLLPRLHHTVTAFQLFRYSAVTWNPHRIHFDESYAHQEGHGGLALHSHLRAALALRCVTEGLALASSVPTLLSRPVTWTTRLSLFMDSSATGGSTGPSGRFSLAHASALC
jgi:acyl dehydratase